MLTRNLACSAFGRVALASGFVSLVVPAASATQQWETELGIGAPFPVDCAVRDSGRRAAVRSAITTGLASAPFANGISVWNLNSVGQCVNAQTWFADPHALGTTNLSNGLRFVTVP